MIGGWYIFVFENAVPRTTSATNVSPTVAWSYNAAPKTRPIEVVVCESFERPVRPGRPRLAPQPPPEAPPPRGDVHAPRWERRQLGAYRKLAVTY